MRLFWSNRKQIDAARRVRRGAAFLDQQWPHWLMAVDPELVDIGSANGCILARVAPEAQGFWGSAILAAADNPLIFGTGPLAPARWATAHGFMLRTGVLLSALIQAYERPRVPPWYDNLVRAYDRWRYRYLNQAWRKEIRARQRGERRALVERALTAAFSADASGASVLGNPETPRRPGGAPSGAVTMTVVPATSPTPSS